MHFGFVLPLVLAIVAIYHPPLLAKSDRQTTVSIHQGKWHLNGKVTYPGAKAEGLLMNVRMVNAVFEDANDKTRPKNFDADVNTDRFIRKIPDYVDHGVRAFTLCLQGGTPGYEGAVNTCFRPDGSLRESYLKRVQKVIEVCDRHGAVVILGCYYQRQDQILRDEKAVKAGVVNVVRWIRKMKFGNVVLEITNEFGHGGFNHAILKSAKGQVELIQLAKKIHPKLLVSTSDLGGGSFQDTVARASDFLLIHFNNTRLENYQARIKSLKKYGKPIVCNEDQKYGKDGAKAAQLCVENGASWGLMEEHLNQHFPFTFKGAADDPAIYDMLKTLAKAGNEKWSFVGKKEKNCNHDGSLDAQQGDNTDHGAMDVEDQLVVGMIPGKRS
ncbi:MAG: hypothetical protein AB7P49_16870 [Bdellovibrionales bacterium]